MGNPRIRLLLSATLCALLWGCRASPPPAERTDDGLVRVPSRAVAGVYRNPDADFTGYKRVMIEPLSIEYTRDWRRLHRDVEDSELRRIETEARESFREEFLRALVERGPYELSDTRAPGVLHVTPRVIELDIPAPEVSVQPGTKSYAPEPVSMQIIGEVRDAATDTLLMRVIVFEGRQRYPFDELRLANRTTNAHEMRTGFGRWSRIVREALDVAKAQRPRE
jgi:hypothetical protein